MTTGQALMLKYWVLTTVADMSIQTHSPATQHIVILSKG